MKRIILALFTIALVGVTAIGCKKEKAKKTDCATVSENFSSTLSTYIASPTPANCLAYKNALQDYLNSDCVIGLTQNEKTELRNQLNGLNCQ